MKWLVAALMLWGAGAEAACRQALALGLDVSGSVDAREYRLQTNGLAAALEHPEVRAAFMAMPDTPIALAIYEWSGPGAQRVVQDWVIVSDDATLSAVTARLRAVQRSGMDLSTALGEAKGFGAALLDRGPVCWRQVLDISGDGKSNGGPRPQDVRPAGILVNGLVIGDPPEPGREGPGLGELSAYYQAYVIQGPDAFVETAAGFAAFEKAMVRKLLRELEVQVIGSAVLAPRALARQ